MSKRLFFMIEGGKMLELVKKHIADRQATFDRSRAIGIELGAADLRVSDADGKVLAVRFKGTPHPDFNKPGKAGSLPRKGTEWERRFAAQVGYEECSQLIMDELDIPFGINYRYEKGSGSRLIGVPYTQCGFLFLGKDGPYAMWIPDIEAEVQADQAKGFTVDEPALSFKAEFDGCRRIKIEEWEFLVAQRNLEKVRAA